MNARLNDHELTVLVEAAASGAVNSRAAIHGGSTWDEMDPATKNNYREAALPFILHGTKELASLGYRKPRTITTREEVEALWDGSVVSDSAGDVSEKRGGLWCSYETAPMSDSRLAKYLPATVLHEGA
jgi:hypothetical protein